MTSLHIGQAADQSGGVRQCRQLMLLTTPRPFQLASSSQSLKVGAQMNTDGGGSPMVKPKRDRQVEYLDLDLDPGKSTPPRKVCQEFAQTDYFEGGDPMRC